MNKIGLVLISITVGSAFSGAALAADMAVKSPVYKAPPPVAVYNWGGFYVGLNGGGGSDHSCWNLTGASAGGVTVFANPAIPEGCNNATGGTIGGQIGYRWQVTNWVFGVEAQGNWANFSGSNVNPGGNVPGILVAANAFNDVTKVNSFGLFTGQVGRAFNNVLIYFKGGAAVVNDKYSFTLTPVGAALAVPAGVGGQTYASGSETRWGGTVGAGVEFGFAPHWSVALEYDHLFMGTKNVTQTVLPPFAAASLFHNISQDIDIGTVRVNYTFGGPVVAKY